MSDENILDDVLPETGKSRHSKLLNQLKELDDFADSQSTSTFVVSSTPDWLPKQKTENGEEYTYKKGRKKKKKEKIRLDSGPVDSDDDWMNHFLEMDSVKVSGKKRRKDFVLNEDGEIERKKKKKKKKDGEPTDFVKEFSPEMALYRGLLRDQSALVDSLQRQYNGMISTKGSSRGITKVTTDLVANISAARSTAMQLIDKTVALKKTCYDLAAKEKKEMGGLGDGENMSDYAGAYLKQIISARDEIRNLSDYEVSEMDPDSMADILDDVTTDIQRDDEVDRYLKYEGRKPQIYAVVNPSNIEDYYFIALDSDGIELDYPLPPMSKLSINRSTEMATDEYGRKYPVKWKDEFE